MSSKNYKKYLSAKIALDGGYNPCNKFSGNENLWAGRFGCDPGFIPDKWNGYCYKVLPTLENFEDGEKICDHNYSSEIVLFYMDAEVSGLVELIERGKTFFCLSFIAKDMKP